MLSKLDLVIPCFNPIKNWETNLLANVTKIQLLLPETQLVLYLVNDGSTKEISQEKIDKIRLSLPHFHYIQYPKNKGKGFALRQGVQQTTNPFCIYTDIDFPYTEDSFLKIYQELLAGEADIAVGVRDQDYYATVPATRVKISKMLRFLAKKLLFLPVNDTQAGLKGFNRHGREIFLKTTIDRYLIDLEFLFEGARLPDIRIKPVKVILRPGIVFSKMDSRILLTESYSFGKSIVKHLRSKISKSR